MGEPAVALRTDWHTERVAETADLCLTYTGPKDRSGVRVIVAFPPFDYPFEGAGWGARSFAKRGIAHVCVSHRRPDWYQNNGFFPAMTACRAYLGPAAQIAAYGFSMGGYGAFLGAAALGADQAVAISPQVTIDPAVPPGERRFAAQWADMGDWRHDLGQAMDDARGYTVLFDPLHPRDSRQEALIPRVAGYRRCLIHGAGHAAIQTLSQAGIAEALFALLIGQASASDLRRAYRAGRGRSFRYLRKVGTRAHDRGHPLAAHYATLAQAEGFGRLMKRWSSGKATQ